MDPRNLPIPSLHRREMAPVYNEPHQQAKSYKHKEGNSLVYEPESVFQAVPAVDRAGSQTQQDRRFRQLQLPSSIRWHRLQTIVARDAPLAADKREAGVRVFQSSDTAGDARAVCLGLRGLRIGELARILDESAAGATTAYQRPFARERSLDGGVAVYCFCQGQGGRVDVDGAAVECLGDELDVEMVPSVNTA